MKGGFRSFILHFAEHRLWWFVFILFSVLFTGYGAFHLRSDNRLHRFCRQEALFLLAERFGPGPVSADRLEANRRGLARLEISYVAVDSSGKAVEWRGVGTPGFFMFPGELIDPTLNRVVREFGKAHPPLSTVRKGVRLRVYYDYPYWFGVQNLHPWLEILFLVFVSALVYYSLRNRGLIQQARLWVNFAKETAHQLGTPLSSLYGWVEMLKLKLLESPDFDPEKVRYILNEASEDVKKLHRRVHRFSQIGSNPELAQNDLNEVVKEVVHYFRDRLPKADRTIQIVANYDEIPPMMLNRDLMGWVFENLLKNSMDAIQKKEGIIQIETRYLKKEEKVRITHTDNGSGIAKENFQRIFQPGFSTKKHGWGLGLALARRIVTDYHGGRIFVESSQSDRGATFVVELPVRTAG